MATIAEASASAGVPAAAVARSPVGRTGRSTRFAVAVLAALTFAAVGADVLAPHDPSAQSLAHTLEAPSLSHPLGRDRLGRDTLSRLLFGARASLEVGALTISISMLIGTFVGSLAGYRGGRTDFWLMRAVDVLLAFPGILLAIAMSAVLGPSLVNVVVALSLIGWTGYARLVRGEVLSIVRREHVEAARALGVSGPVIVTRHVLPLLAGPLLVQATFGMAGAIVAEASLSFLGLGVQPPTPSWGSMLNEGRAFLLTAPHLTVFPGMALALTVAALNFLGDATARRLDVRRTD